MKNFLNKRAISIGKYILKTGQTVRQAAVVYGVSKSTVHNDVAKRLKTLDFRLYKKVQLILTNNFKEKHLRGGQATKIKYLKNKKLNHKK